MRLRPRRYQRTKRKLEQSLKEFEECKTKMPTDAADRCKPLEEQYEKAQRELSYLVHEQNEEERFCCHLKKTIRS